MPYRLVDVVAGPKTPRDRVALYDVHPDHPPSPGRPDGGEIWITANEPREPHRVAETPDVLQALRDGRLKRWDEHASDNPAEARRGIRALQRRVGQLQQAEKDNPALVLMPETAAKHLAREESDFDDEELADFATRGVDKWQLGSSATSGGAASDAESIRQIERERGPSASERPIHSDLSSLTPSRDARRGREAQAEQAEAERADPTQRPVVGTGPGSAGLAALSTSGSTSTSTGSGSSGDGDTLKTRQTVTALRERIANANRDELREIESEEGQTGEPRQGVTEAIERRYRALDEEDKSK